MTTYLEVSDEGAARRAARLLTNLGDRLAEPAQPPQPEEVLWGEDEFGAHMRNEYTKLAVEGGGQPLFLEFQEQQKTIGARYTELGEGVEKAVNEFVAVELMSMVDLDEDDDGLVIDFSGSGSGGSGGGTPPAGDSQGDPESGSPGSGEAPAPAVTAGAGESSPAGKLYRAARFAVRPGAPGDQEDGDQEGGESDEETAPGAARMYKSASWSTVVGEASEPDASDEPAADTQTETGRVYRAVGWSAPTDEPATDDAGDDAGDIAAKAWVMPIHAAGGQDGAEQPEPESPDAVDPAEPADPAEVTESTDPDGSTDPAEPSGADSRVLGRRAFVGRLVPDEAVPAGPAPGSAHSRMAGQPVAGSGEPVAPDGRDQSGSGSATHRSTAYKVASFVDIESE